MPVLFSVVIHAVTIAALVYIPMLFPREHVKPIQMFSVELTALPGPAGGGGESETPVNPKEKPEEVAKAPEPDAVKIAKPEKEKKKPDKKTEPPKKIASTVVPSAPKGPGQGPAGGGAKETVDNGPVAFDVGPDSPFRFYAETLQQKIGKRWQPPGLTVKAPPKVIVFFRIDRTGRISDVAVEQSSGIAFFDRSALSAVMGSNPLPPLPTGYKGDRLGVHYTFKI